MIKTIEVNQLKKAYGTIEAVKGIDFYVEQGALFAFLGPNGAGKSTTINILGTLLEADEGTVLINGWALGQDDHNIRQDIGVVFQDQVLDPRLTVRENLLTRGSFYHKNKTDLLAALEEAARKTGVSDCLDRTYATLSGGQKRRADLARALIHTPRILFLDEPTTGLDPQTRQKIWDAIDHMRQENDMTIFFSTHYMEEADRADDVVIIDDGLIAAQGSPARLKDRYSTDQLILITDDRQALCDLLAPFQLPMTTRQDTVTIQLKKTLEAMPLLDACRNHISGFQVLEGDLDDAFIAITGKEIRE